MSRASRLRGVLWAGIGLLAVALAALIAIVATPTARSRYVTAVATTGSVTQTFTATGTVTRANLVQARFLVAGTVAAVAVSLGESVEAGQVLARLDRAPLRLARLEAEAALAQAESNLYDARHPAADQRTGTLPTTGTVSTGIPGGITVPGGAAGGGTAAALAAVEQELAAVRVALAAQQQACAPVFAAGLLPPGPPGPPASGTPSPTASPSTPAPTAAPGTSASPGTASPTASPTADPTSPSASPTSPSSSPTSPSASPTPTPSASPSPTPSTTPTPPTAAELQACAAALAVLAQAEARAAAALGQAAAALGGAGGLPTTGGAGSGTSGGGLPSVPTVTVTADPAAVARAQAAVLDAEQGLARAEDDLAAADLTAPVAGSVGALDLTPGGPSSGSVSIVGDGAALVTVEVPVATRGQLAVGRPAQVSPAGGLTRLPGTVTTISLLETAGTAGDNPSFATTVTVSDPELRLVPGSRAAVSIGVRTVEDVVTVPASAVTPIAPDTATVQVLPSLAAETPDLVRVSTGTVGGGRVEIRTGLEPGQIVVLADRTAEIPAFVIPRRDTTTAPAAPTATPSPSPSASR